MVATAAGNKILYGMDPQQEGVRVVQTTLQALFRSTITGVVHGTGF